MPQTSLIYEIKATWNFSLNFSLNSNENTFYTKPVTGEKGDVFIYSFDQDEPSSLALDGTFGIYSDFKMTLADQLVGKISDTKNFRFSVLITTGPITKYIRTEYPKYYAWPGIYTLRAWLDDTGPFNWTIQVLDGISIDLCFNLKLFFYL